MIFQIRQQKNLFKRIVEIISYQVTNIESDNSEQIKHSIELDETNIKTYKVISDKYFRKLSIKEISENNNVCITLIRQNLTKFRKNLKKIKTNNRKFH